MERRDLQRYPTIADCRRGARRRLPRFLFDYLDGGTDSELAPARNREAFRAITIAPRTGRAVEAPNLGSEVFGRRWSLPFGVCPCGYVDMLDPGTEMAAARAAEVRGAPFIASMSTIVPLEELAAAAPTVMWQQVQASRDPAIAEAIVERALMAGVKVLVVTMDIATASKRVRDLRNGFTLPLKPTLRLAWDLATSPSWVAATVRRPDPKPGNFLAHLPDGVTSTRAAIALEEQIDCITTWDDLARFRDAWPGKLVAKGIQSPADARRAVALGCDAVMVSNHGGRQYDAAPATIDALPAIVAAIGERAPVFLDSGVRSGLDVMKALHRGASLVFAGRAFYYAAGAMGRRGPAFAFDLIRDELVVNMRQAGFRSVVETRAGHDDGEEPEP